MSFDKHDVKSKKQKKAPAAAPILPVVETLESRTLLSTSPLIADPSIAAIPDASAVAITGYSPAEIRNAYGFNSVILNNGSPGTGAGQTIAIVDAYGDPNITSDLAAFDATYGLAAPGLTVVGQSGASTLPAANTGWSLETSLDVEWAHAIAPGASLLLVEANSDSLNDLGNAVNFARGARGVTVVSMSWGTGEFSNETTYDPLFTTTAGHQNVTFVAASGDEGSWNGPEWAASSQNVLSVGGTTLHLANASGTYGGETGWAGSTGGLSAYEPEPSYQRSAQTTGADTSPDVAYDANPSTGFAVYDSVTDDGENGWWDVGGTSAGAPQWAALIAIADQGRVLQGLSTLNSATQTLPLLFSFYNQNQYPQAFHDESIGASSRYFSAAPGYDAVTGLGSPRADFLVQELIGATAGGDQGAVVSVTGTTLNVRSAFARPMFDGRPPMPVAATTLLPTQVAPQTSAAAINNLQTGTTNTADASASSGGAGASTTGDVASAQLGSTPVLNSTASFGSHQLLQTANVTATLQSTPSWPSAIADFSPIPAFAATDQEIAVSTAVFNASRIVSRVDATSADLVESLALANAAAFAKVANNLAAHLFDEDLMIWKDTALLVFAGAVVGGHLARPRAGRNPAKKFLKHSYFCVGEEKSDGYTADF